VLRPFTGGTEDSVAVAEVPLDCTTWEIAVDVSGPVALAGVDAARVETDFYRSFAIGSAAALIAAISVVVLLLNAERVARERSRFAAAAAHELRTPLAGLRMYGEMLGGVADDPDRSQRYAMVVDDGIVSVLHVEENPGACEVSAGEALLSEI